MVLSGTEGGAGIEKNLNVGGAVSFTGPSVGVAVTLAETLLVVSLLLVVIYTLVAIFT